MKESEYRSIKKRIKIVRKDVLRMIKRYDTICDRMPTLDALEYGMKPQNKKQEKAQSLQQELDDIFDLLELIPTQEIRETIHG